MTEQFTDIRKVLVLKLRHIGDVLLTVPAIRAVRESFPGAAITALVNSGTEDVLRGNPLVDEVLVFRRAVKGMALPGRLKAESSFVRGLRQRRFDMAIDLTGGDRPALLCLLSGARYRLGYEPRGGFAGKRLLYTHLAGRPSRRTHTVLRDLGVVRSFGMDTADLRVDIHPSPDDEASVEALLRQAGVRPGSFAHIHPTSRWFFKCWTDAGMAFIMDRLHEKGIRSVLTSGPEERERARAASILALSRKADPLDLSGSLGLGQLAALSARSLFFFGVDTAPMHIAAASGAPVVALFGPSGAFDWGPWDNSAVYSPGGPADSPYPAASGVQSFGRNTVIQVDWECAPCGGDGCDGSKRSRCLDELDPGFVMGVIVRSLGL